MAAMGDTERWHQLYAVPSDVYLWRARLSGVKVDEPADAQALSRAVARAIADMGLDVRGIVVDPKPEGTDVDVVLTSDSRRPYWLGTSAYDVGGKLREDDVVSQRYPQLGVINATFLSLTAPPASKDFWLSHPIIWDDATGPLDAFAKQQGIYRPGRADDGPQLQAWQADVAPPVGPPPTPDPASPGLSGGIAPLMLALLGAGAVYLAASYATGAFDERKRPR